MCDTFRLHLESTKLNNFEYWIKHPDYVSRCKHFNSCTYNTLCLQYLLRSTKDVELCSFLHFDLIRFRFYYELYGYNNSYLIQYGNFLLFLFSIVFFGHNNFCKFVVSQFFNDQYCFHV